MVCIGANYISSCDWRKFEVKRKEGNYCLEDSSSTFWYNSEPWPVMIIVNGLASSSHHRLRGTKEKRQADGPTDWTPHCCCRMAWPHKAYPLSLFHRRLDDLYAAVFPCLPHYMSQFRVEWSLLDGCAEHDWLRWLLAEMITEGWDLMREMPWV